VYIVLLFVVQLDFTAIMWAALYGYTGILRHLLSAGANEDFKNEVSLTLLRRVGVESSLV